MASVHCEENIGGGGGGEGSRGGGGGGGKKEKKPSSDTRRSWQSRQTYLAPDKKRKDRVGGEWSEGGSQGE